MNEKPEMMINIFGSNNQIFPVATTAVQNFYGDQGTAVAVQSEDSVRVEEVEEMTEDEIRLSIYVPDMQHLRAYEKLIGECTNAHELATIVVEGMLIGEERIRKETVVKGSFIELLQPFATRLVSGNTVDNIRQHINKILTDRKGSRR